MSKKKTKLSTPAWILEGYDSPEEHNKSRGISKKKKIEGKTFKIRACPKCGNDEIKVVLGKEEGKGTGDWECKKCGWAGQDIIKKELGEDEMMKYLDEKGEEVA